jgi:hypothetical protein
MSHSSLSSPGQLLAGSLTANEARNIAPSGTKLQSTTALELAEQLLDLLERHEADAHRELTSEA